MLDSSAGVDQSFTSLSWVGEADSLPPPTNILGVGISAINMDMAVRTISRWIRAREKHYVCITGVHGVMESQRDAGLKAIHNAAGMATPDGMPLVVLSRLLGKSHVDRVYGPDLMLEVCRTGEDSGIRHYLYGATPATLANLERNLRQKFPRIQIAGVYSPPFRPLTAEEVQDVTDRINQSAADIVWVGLSTPKQEKWMHQFRPVVDAPVMVGVGAAFDFHAGQVSQAPRWMQRSCLEWFYRLTQEPKRLWRRYLINNPAFLFLICLQFLGLRRFPLPETTGN